MLSALVLLAGGQEAAPVAAHGLARPLEAVPFQSVRLADAFFAPRIETNRRVTIPTCLDQCEKTGRIRNFAVAAGAEGKHEGLLFNDSDLYKVLEGAAYTLKAAPDPALEKRVDAIVELVAAAQRPDGYLDTYFQLVEPESRWKKEKDGHELYCAGHLIEAAVAYERATGKQKLLEVAIRLADCIDREYGWGKHQEATGHEELELALVKLARRTNEKRYLELAKFFVEVRGRKDRGTPLFGEYAQDHAPVREQTEVVGHAVRATYLFCGMADLAGAARDPTLLAPLLRIFDDVVARKMYLTGGIGSSGSNEGFTRPFDLPNDTAYCETCASIGMALWSHRMFLLTGETRFADVLEREIYNNIPAGVSLSGDRFFYDNPLASRGGSERLPWFDCSCCPTNLVRFLPAMGERMYAVSGRDLHVLLYAGSTADVELAGGRVRIVQETEYPRTGTVRVVVASAPKTPFALHLRVPGWCGKAKVEPEQVAVRKKDPASDEFVIDRTWKNGDAVVLDLEMQPRRVRADPAVEADRGRVALARGPLVYALEGVDHGGRARNLVLPPDAELSAAWDPARLGGTTVLRAHGAEAFATDPLRRSVRPADLVAIPYALWANRGKDEMVVWIPEDSGLAEIPGAGVSATQDGVLLRASHVWKQDTLLALNDKKIPGSSSDDTVPRLTFWDHRGTREWIEMDFAASRRVAASRVYWFDDEGTGGCRAPARARILVRVGEDWQPIDSPVGVEKDRWNATSFPAVETSAVRMEIDLRPEKSAGVLEWQLE